MNGIRDRFLSVLTLLCRVPLRTRFEADFSRADFWIPALSPLVSLTASAGGLLAWLAFGDPLLAALGAMAAQYLAFNLFHVDGLLDTADAMATQATKERRLEILKDSRIGSYAFFYGLLVLGSKVALLALLFRDGMVMAAFALLAAPLAGRLACALVPLFAPPARPEGLGALMKGFTIAGIGLGALCASLPLVALSLVSGEPGLGAAGVVSVLAAGAGAGLGLARLYRGKVGGFTGDALGAAVEAGELGCVALLAAASRLFALVAP